MFLIIGIWGGANRIYARFKFFLYTFLGSVLMLVAMVAMFADAGHDDIPTLMTHTFASETSLSGHPGRWRLADAHVPCVLCELSR